MIYWWAKVGQAVECVQPFPVAANEPGRVFVAQEGSVYTIAKASPGFSITTGEFGIGIGLKEDPTWEECGWDITHFRPVWPQRLEELRRLAEGIGGDAKAPRRLEEV